MSELMCVCVDSRARVMLYAVSAMCTFAINNVAINIIANKLTKLNEGVPLQVS